MKYKKYLLKILFLIIIIISSNISYANTEDTIEEQQASFGINTFIKNSKQYTGEFFEDIDINDILNNAIKGEVDNSTIYKRILNLLGTEVKTSINAILSILIIIVIHSILNAISESLENDNVSKLIYYVQYISIVTIIMSNFSDIITMIRDTCTNLVGFMNMLIPILISLMLYTGNITTGSILEPIILFMINFISNIIQNLIIPIVLIIATFCILSKLTDKIQIDKIAKFFKSSVTWFLGIILTIFVGVISLEGTLSGSVDAITVKTTKAIVSSAVPVIGKILGDAVESVLGCGVILKNAVGIVGVIIIIGICIMPIIKLGTLTICYKLLAGVSEPIADGKIVKLLDQVGDIFKIFLAILSAISVMLIIGITLIVKISNI